VIGLAVFVCERDCDTLVEPSWKWASTMHQRFLVLWVRLLNKRHGRCNTYSKYCPPLRPQILVSTSLLSLKDEHQGVSTISVLAPWIIKQLCNYIKLEWKCWLPLCVQMAGSISVPPGKNERQRSVIDVLSRLMDTQSAVHQLKFIINPWAAFVGKNASDNIPTTSKWVTMEHQWFLATHLG